MIAHLPQRLRDWLLERRIASKRSQMNCAWSQGNIALFDKGLADLNALIAQKKLTQIARMKGRGE